MIRLTALLCGGIFLVLLIAGQDHGQMREGLRAPPVLARTAPPAAPHVPDPAAKVIDAVYVPSQPVRVVAAAPVPVQPDPIFVAPAPEVPQPQDRLAVVNARAVNVRSGPSTSASIIGRLGSNEQVLMVIESGPVEGWTLIQIEGDGIKGYVATRLLQPLDP